MFSSILIANRGEIARRIIRTARRLGIRTVAVYSDADASMPFVREADEAVRIGPAPARESYLVQEKLLAVARETGAQAIHPGYGFLSENADFAEAVEAAGLVWIGAPPSAIRAMGLKHAAKQLMADAGVPVTPGYLGGDQNVARLQAESASIGYPVLIKAVAGGGGKGMRKVENAADFKDALHACQREAKGAFGDDRVLIEKYIKSPRHIEVQVFGDRFGHVVHMFERDCSLQRRHQKVIEEAPAPGMNAETRAALCAMAVSAAKAVDYVGAGTIEFIADASEGLRADRIWFMEMNTRLQVEHPVTEAITGLDLVEWQFLAAASEPLPLAQDDIRMNGWAMEARLYAENPASGFLPSIGRLEHLHLPDGVRIDAGVEQGDEVTPHYDPLIAKIIAYGPSRQSAAARLADACEQVEVWPVKTNAAFLARAARDADFLAGKIDTGFIERSGVALIPGAAPAEAVLQAAARALLPGAATRADPWTALCGFRIAGPPERRVEVEVAGHAHVVTLSDPPAQWSAVTDFTGERVLFWRGEAWPFGGPAADHIDSTGGASDGAIFSPMPGRVIAVDVEIGRSVRAGQKLLTMEAMKMEHAMHAPFDGVVKALNAEVGQQVSEGALLAQIEKDV
jgi:3-methylcrotonyl-CoA carboxylase alpha subunit